MIFSTNDDRVLTELDHTRISKLDAHSMSPDFSSLLNIAELVPSELVPDNIITMNSRILVEDVESGDLQELSICYPADANFETQYISVLSPLGMALIGRCVGSTISWVPPTGRICKMTIHKILYQPEESGDYLT